MSLVAAALLSILGPPTPLTNPDQTDLDPAPAPDPALQQDPAPGKLKVLSFGGNGNIGSAVLASLLDTEKYEVGEPVGSVGLSNILRDWSMTGRRVAGGRCTALKPSPL